MKEFAHNISRAKDYFLSPGDPGLAKIDDRKKFCEIYALYEERLARTGNVDFGDLIKKPVEILRKEPEAARRIRERFSVIMVDEYQDANVAQFTLLKELVGPDTYICVVGDDDQSIYRFRGAEVKNILEFPDRFPDTEIIRLENNYRSTAPILRTASSVVDHNRGRLGKTLRTVREGGKQPILAFLPDQDEEVVFCADLIENSVRKNDTNARWSDLAVLYRTNAQSAGFETEFLRRGIPYKVVGSLKFYEREEIKDALALLAFLANHRDEVAFRRMVNKPTRGIGPVTVDRIIEANARESVLQEGGLLETAKNMTGELAAKAGKGLKEFIKIIEKGKNLLDQTGTGNGTSEAGDSASGIKSAAKKKKKGRVAKDGEIIAGEGLSVCVAQLIKDSLLVEYHIMHDEIAGNQRIANLQELVNAASLYEGTRQGLLEFLEHIELDRTIEDTAKNELQKDSGNTVTFITFHNTKGLEFSRVIMTGLEQGVFPREDKRHEELEEERRLFYVGATRAMDELYLCSCAVRRMYGRTMPVYPSVFLREVDKNCLRTIGNAPPGFGFAARFPRTQENIPHGGYRRSANGESEVERKAGWRRGQKLFHDDYGYGSVAEVRDSEEGPVVRVRFETGMELRFFSETQGGAFDKIGDDY